ncbi:MAG: hypothetical protein JWO82_365 [Akkermansiaceae bacterium]|nr:hypothetical protein [Akkermansiaceae bacterium]
MDLKTTFALISLPAALTGCAHQTVVKSTGGLVDKSGATYYLPATVVVASIPVEKTVSGRAPYAFYARPFLGIAANLSPDKISYSIGDEVTLSFAGERDPAEKFVLVFPSGPFKTFNQVVTVNGEGVLTTGTGSVENKSVEFAVSTLGAVAKVGTSAFAAASGDAFARMEAPGLAQLREHLNDDFNEEGKFLTKEALSAGLAVMLSGSESDTVGQIDKLISENLADDQQKGEEYPLLKTLAQNDTNKKNVDFAKDYIAWKRFRAERKKAYREVQNAVEEFKKLKSVEALMATPRTSTDYAYYAAERDKLRAEFASAAKEKSTWVSQFRWTPPSRLPDDFEGPNVESKTLLTLKNGKITYGEHILPETFPKSDFWSNKATGELSVIVTLKSQIPKEAEFWNKQLKGKQERGWHYRIPAPSTVAVYAGGDPSPKVVKQTYIGQQGCVAFLPATTASHKITSNVELDPVTGALKATTMGGEAFDPGLITTAGASVSGAIDAAAARDAKDDYVSELTRKKAILQLKSDIETLQKPKP